MIVFPYFKLRTPLMYLFISKGDVEINFKSQCCKSLKQEDKWKLIAGFICPVAMKTTTGGLDRDGKSLPKMRIRGHVYFDNEKCMSASAFE